MLSDYFQIIDRAQEGEQHIYTVRLNKDCHVFEGHFPDEPIAPGVCNILMILRCAEDALGRPMELSSISRCKFTSLIRPDGQDLHVQFSLCEQILTASLWQNETLCMQLSGTI